MVLFMWILLTLIIIMPLGPKFRAYNFFLKWVKKRS